MNEFQRKIKQVSDKNANMSKKRHTDLQNMSKNNLLVWHTEHPTKNNSSYKSCQKCILHKLYNDVYHRYSVCASYGGSVMACQRWVTIDEIIKRFKSLWVCSTESRNESKISFHEWLNEWKCVSSVLRLLKQQHD